MGSHWNKVLECLNACSWKFNTNESSHPLFPKQIADVAFELCLGFFPKLTIEVFSTCLDGFRKVVGAEQGGLRAEKDDWQFQNANFIRSQPRLLENVKRKVQCLTYILYYQSFQPSSLSCNTLLCHISWPNNNSKIT